MCASLLVWVPLVACSQASSGVPSAWAALADGGAGAWVSDGAPWVAVVHGPEKPGAARVLRVYVEAGPERSAAFGRRPACEVSAASAVGSHDCGADRQLTVTAAGEGLQVALAGDGWSVPTGERTLGRTTPTVVAFDWFGRDAIFPQGSPETEHLRPLLDMFPMPWSAADVDAAVAERGVNPAAMPLPASLCLQRELSGAAAKLAGSARNPNIDPRGFAAELLGSALDTCVPAAAP